MSTLALTFGVGMTTLACMVPWLKRLKAGPGGFEAETRDPAVTTTEVAEESLSVFVQDKRRLSPAGMDGAALVEIANATLTSLLNPQEGPLAGCDLHLYMFDADDERLLPVFEPPEGEPAEGWAVGQGAVGQAWSVGRYVLVTGQEVHNDTYGLSSEQQIRYQDVSAVAATPVLNQSGEVIAILSASDRGPSTQLSSDAGYEEHLWLSFVVGTLLTEVLKWEDD